MAKRSQKQIQYDNNKGRLETFGVNEAVIAAAFAALETARVEFGKAFPPNVDGSDTDWLFVEMAEALYRRDGTFLDSKGTLFTVQPAEGGEEGETEETDTLSPDAGAIFLEGLRQQRHDVLTMTFCRWQQSET